MKHGLITGWNVGDVVRTTREIRMFTRPDVCPVGTVMPLTRLERIQDGKEIWVGWPEGEAQFWCFAHTSVELVDKEIETG